VRAKFLVVFCVSLISVVVNAAGMLLSWLAGFGPERFGGADFSFPPARTLAVVALLAAPLAVFTSAILLAISACARSFREAQTYLLPLTLAALLGVLLASSPHVELESLVSLVPIANASLGIRRAIEGRLTVGGFTAVLGASSVLAGLALWKAAQLLRREDVVLNLEPPPLTRDANAEGRARRGLYFAWSMLLLTYFAAHWTQGKDPLGGLAVTLWGFVLIPALAYPLLVRVPLREVLAWRAPGARNLLLAVAAAAAAFPAIIFYSLVQSSFFPLPEAFAESTRMLTETSPALLFFLIAFSPAICEELLWRGAVQGELEPRRRAARTVVTIGLLFGLFHWSTHRFVSTALLGMILALIRTRTGSIFPCMLFHALYNAGFIGIAWWAAATGVDEETCARRLAHPALVPLALAVLAASLWGLRARDRGPGSAGGAS
jgi:membrane protease YdiL (CAAX protease family)